MKVKDIFYLSGTHWDREWYQTFQGFRNRLVETVDDMIDYLEKDDKFGVFHFDGQTIVLEDYAEIAPENTDRLKKLISDGKIKVGPWYDMPDEFLLSGESLIRNLMKGTRLAKKWGAEPWQVGYICDIFGHIAQTPQIFDGFGINHSILGRGMREDAKTFFRWQSPDGTECFTFHLNPHRGYGYMWGWISAECKNPDNYDELKAVIKAAVDEEIERSNSSVLILMEAQDHIPIEKNTPKYIEIIKELYPDINVHHCDIAEAQEIIESEADNFPVLTGEINAPAENVHPYLHLITNTLSSYYTHKKSNDECQNLLEKVLEPMTLFSGLNGKKIRRSYINLAYQYLLQNHPHDSICGCSIDQVHKDMVYRFDQVKEIGEILTENFLYENRPEAGKDSEYALKLYNPLPFARRECVTTEIILKKDFPTKYSEPFGYEDIFSFKVLDENGNDIPYERVKMVKNYIKHSYKVSTEDGECYTISFMADMPACGYKEYRIVPFEKPVRYMKKMVSGADFVENDFVRVSITQNGEINIFDKKTKAEYKNLASFIDDGEIGDGWYHANPVNDVTVYSASTGARVEKIENGPSRCVFRVTKVMEVPECMNNAATGKSRSERYVKMPISLEVGLSENARFADVKLTVDNTAKDHRLRLSIPTDIDNKKYFAGQTFYCNERKTGIDYTMQNWREHDQYEKQTNGILGKRDESGNGIAFVSAYGLHECAGYDDGSLAVTLFRAFKTTVSTMGEKNGQMSGELEYKFLLAPIDKTVTYSELVKLQDRLAAAPAYSCSEVSSDYKLTQKSFAELSGENINMSIIKTPEDEEENALIVRVFNASAENADGKITFFKDIKNAYVTNLNEDVKSEIKADGNTLNISLAPWKIGTYKVKF